MSQKKPLVLMILDGWGYRSDKVHNAIANAKTPQWDKWWQNNPHILLQASGKNVGLPDEQMGNSEVGHMHIGAGRIISQEFTRINQMIDNGEFAKNEIFLNLLHHLKKDNKALHVMGLLSPGGVHSHEEHLFAFLKLCHQQEFKQVYLHLFLDGRDTPPQSALNSIRRLKKVLKQYPVAQIASICGRYFAMDRDKRWERTALVYRLFTEKNTHSQFSDAETAINHFYSEDRSDEFIPPTIIGEGRIIEEGDSVFFFNFRADRARQLCHALLDKEFHGFIRSVNPLIDQFVSMTHYANDLMTDAAFPQLQLRNTLGEVIANEGLTQLRIAETEKYAHVTFFLNGGNETVFANEDRILIPSPPVSTYDLQPEMSALALTRALVDAIDCDAYDVIICNYANADMVGHTGDFSATIKAIEFLDQCFVEIDDAIMKKQGGLLITADHGNAEFMFNEQTQQAHTAHTCQPVPLLYVGGGWRFKENANGTLVDVAPTFLSLLEIDKPREMTGNSLMVRDHVI